MGFGNRRKRNKNRRKMIRKQKKGDWETEEKG
jgi:hypothetical protein